MRKIQTVTLLIVLALFINTGTCLAQKSKAAKLLEGFTGKWEGSCKTWTRPGAKADESRVIGEFKTVSGTGLFRHVYQGSFKGKRRTGEETMAFNSTEDEFQVSWFDTFHMNYAILFSVGKPHKDGKGFSVVGKYRMDPKQKYWKWRTEYVLKDQDQLLITAFNILPDGREAKAIEIVYKRVE